MVDRNDLGEIVYNPAETDPVFVAWLAAHPYLPSLWTQGVGEIHPTTTANRVLIGGVVDNTSSLLQTPHIALSQLTGDPATLLNGLMWFRGDLGELRIRIGAVTYKITVSPV